VWRVHNVLAHTPSGMMVTQLVSILIDRETLPVHNAYTKMITLKCFDF